MTVRAAATGWALLGRAVVLTSLTGLVAVAGSVVLAGREGVLGALLALGLVLGFLLAGQLPVAQVGLGRPRLGTALLVLVYTLRLMVLVLAFRAFYVSDDVDGRVLGVTVLACGLAWTAGVVWAALRWRPLVVDPEQPAGRRSG